MAQHRLVAVPAADGTCQQVPAGFTTRLASCKPVRAGDAKVHSLEQILGNKGGPADLLGPGPPCRRLPVLPRDRAESRVESIDKFVVATLSSGDLPAEIAWVGEDRSDGGSTPHPR